MRAQISDFVQLNGCSVDLSLAFVRPNVFAVRARGIVLPARVAHAGSWIVPVCRNARRQENNDLFEREDGRVLLCCYTWYRHARRDMFGLACIAQPKPPMMTNILGAAQQQAPFGQQTIIDDAISGTIVKTTAIIP